MNYKTMFDSQHIRGQFPYLKEYPELIFLDTAASAQKPQKVLDELVHFYVHDYANIHRGSYPRADRATDKYELARKKVAKFFNAASNREIIFTKNLTESTNIVAESLYASGMLQSGDKVLITPMEHHSNLVPWLQLKSRGIEIEYIKMNENFDLDMQDAEEKMKDPKVKALAFAYVSNTVGTKTPAKELCKIAKENGIFTCIDGAQAAPHFAVDVQDIDCDFFLAAGHKMYGPSGVGILYGKLDLLKQLPPYNGGGSMIHEVFEQSFVPGEVPARFEAGTPAIAEVVATGAAVDFLEEIGMHEVENHDLELTKYALGKIKNIPHVELRCNPNPVGLVAFSVDGVHDYDIGDELGERGVCVRVGHHCAQPLMDKQKWKTTIRASFGIYTTKKEIDDFSEILEEVIGKLK